MDQAVSSELSQLVDALHRPHQRLTTARVALFALRDGVDAARFTPNAPGSDPRFGVSVFAVGDAILYDPETAAQRLRENLTAGLLVVAAREVVVGSARADLSEFAGIDTPTGDVSRRRSEYNGRPVVDHFPGGLTVPGDSVAVADRALPHLSRACLAEVVRDVSAAADALQVVAGYQPREVVDALAGPTSTLGWVARAGEPGVVEGLNRTLDQLTELLGMTPRSRTDSPHAGLPPLLAAVRLPTTTPRPVGPPGPGAGRGPHGRPAPGGSTSSGTRPRPS